MSCPFIQMTLTKSICGVLLSSLTEEKLQWREEILLSVSKVKAICRKEWKQHWEINISFQPGLNHYLQHFGWLSTFPELILASLSFLCCIWSFPPADCRINQVYPTGLGRDTALAGCYTSPDHCKDLWLGIWYMAKNLQETQLIFRFNDQDNEKNRNKYNPMQGTTFPLSPGPAWKYIAPHWKIKLWTHC